MRRIYNILYVDDEVSNLRIFKNTFRRDYNIFTAESAQEGMKILEQEKIDLVLTDQRMPEMSGVEFLKNVMIKSPEPHRILITAYTDFVALKDAVNQAKIFQYIQKPWDEKEIRQIIDCSLEIYELKQRNVELTEKLKKKNEELIRLNKELMELDHLKFQFLNIISHEIRTPLNGLMGATYLLKTEFSEADYQKYQEMFQILELSTKRLEHFLLLAERITIFKTKSYEISPKNFQLSKLIYDVVKVLNEKISIKNIDLHYDLHEDEGCFADKELLEICLLEVIDNAIKFVNKDGKITIKTLTKNSCQIIEIIDDGPGFPELVLKHIFKTFNTNNNLTQQSMGLDLALINLIIEAHNGKIEIKNNEKCGSTVRFIFNS
jgi:signal transduction histidine kinase